MGFQRKCHSNFMHECMLVCVCVYSWVEMEFEMGSKLPSKPLCSLCLFPVCIGNKDILCSSC
jgi:uncharacterized protein YqhQ